MPLGRLTAYVSDTILIEEIYSSSNKCISAAGCSTGISIQSQIDCRQKNQVLLLIEED